MQNRLIRLVLRASDKKITQRSNTLLRKEDWIEVDQCREEMEDAEDNEMQAYLTSTKLPGSKRAG